MTATKTEDFTQNGEYRVWEKLWPDGFQGRLLEVGAWNPKIFSSSRNLIERGWEAVLFEFSPGPLRDLLVEYGNNPKIKIVGCAMGRTDQGLLEFRITDDAVSSSSKAVQDVWQHVGGYYGNLLVPVMSPIKALTWLTAPPYGFDFCSFDAEGQSVDIMIGYLGAIELLQQLQAGDDDGAEFIRGAAGEAAILPKCICVEHDGRMEEVTDIAARYGYKIELDNGTNAVMVLQK